MLKRAGHKHDYFGNFAFSRKIWMFSSFFFFFEGLVHEFPEDGGSFLFANSFGEN